MTSRCMTAAATFVMFLGCGTVDRSLRKPPADKVSVPSVTLPTTADLAVIKRPVNADLVGAVILIREATPLEFDYICKAEESLPGFVEQPKIVIDADWQNRVEGDLKVRIAEETANDPNLNYLNLKSIKFENSKLASISNAEVIRFESRRDDACRRAITDASRDSVSMVREALRANVVYKFESNKSASASMVAAALRKLGARLGFAISDVARLEGRGEQVVFAIREDRSLLRGDITSNAGPGVPSVPLTLKVTLGGSTSSNRNAGDPLSLSELVASLVPAMRSDLDQISLGLDSPEMMAERVTRLEESVIRIRNVALTDDRQDIVSALDVFRSDLGQLRSAMSTGILSLIRDAADAARTTIDRLR